MGMQAIVAEREVQAGELLDPRETTVERRAVDVQDLRRGRDVAPGVEPWTKVQANPYIWHFAFHSIPVLPETLVAGRERPYFDYFDQRVRRSFEPQKPGLRAARLAKFFDVAHVYE